MYTYIIRYNIQTLAVVGYILYIFVFFSPVSIHYNISKRTSRRFSCLPLKNITFLLPIMCLLSEKTKRMALRKTVDRNKFVYILYNVASHRWVWVFSMNFKSEIERPIVFCIRFFAAAKSLPHHCNLK